MKRNSRTSNGKSQLPFRSVIHFLRGKERSKYRTPAHAVHSSGSHKSCNRLNKVCGKNRWLAVPCLRNIGILKFMHEILEPDSFFSTFGHRRKSLTLKEMHSSKDTQKVIVWLQGILEGIKVSKSTIYLPVSSVLTK